MPSRRRFIAGASIATLALPVGGSVFTGWNGRKWRRSSNEHSRLVDGPAIGLSTTIEGLNQPLALENPIEDHFYVADRLGQVYLQFNGVLAGEPILDIQEKLVMDHGEQGLLGLEFHPDFENNRRFYLRYSSPPRDGTPTGYSHTFVLSEFLMTEDYQGVIAGSERPILEIPEPGRMHNAGGIEFGSDGYLYVPVGDGGGDGHDGSGPLNRGANSHSRDWYLVNIGGNGQDTANNLLGSVLRIDVNDRGEDRAYEVPASNPLTDVNGLEEHYAWGFRNPYSLSFDIEDLYVADAGTKLFEEVNLVERGGNYGWNVKEGSTCHNNFPFLRAFSAADIDVRTLPFCPNEPPDGQELKDPVITYPHFPGGVVIGGHMYRNSTVADISNKYVFGDLRGRLFAATPSDDQEFWVIEELLVAGEGQEKPSKHIGSALLSVDEGRNGELFVLTVDSDGGRVQQIVKP